MSRRKKTEVIDNDESIPHVIDTDTERELVMEDGDEPKELAPACPSKYKKGELIPASKLSRMQLDDAADAVLLGRSVVDVARELGVDPKSLNSAVRELLVSKYQRLWQRSIGFDALRAERILHESLSRLSESPKWGKLALEVLAYRARILGFEKTTLQETSIRVAGLSKVELYQEAIKRL